jgi:outer membrane protein TolC
MFGNWPKNHCAGPLLLIVLATWICTSNSAHAQPAATPEKDKDKAAEIKTLLKERRDTLQEFVKYLVAQAENGRIDFFAVVQAKREALRATLEVDEAPEVRLAALKDYLETAKASLKLAEQGFKAGQVSQVDALKAKAIVLEAQIELLREESKTKQSK